MPRALAALVARAIELGLDPATPSVAVARATQQDQRIIAGQISSLPVMLQRLAPAGPVLVMLGQVFSPSAENADTTATASAIGYDL